jgi:hypothetical protein
MIPQKIYGLGRTLTSFWITFSFSLYRHSIAISMEDPVPSEGPREEQREDQADLATFKKSDLRLLVPVLFGIVAIVAIALGCLNAARGFILEDDSADSFDSADGEPEELASINFFFELKNDSGNDLGAQLKLGSDPLKRFAIVYQNNEQ